MKKHLLFIPYFSALALIISCGGTNDNNQEITIEKDSIITIINTDFETINFKATDSVDIFANEYKIDDTSPVILLCHQARFNKFEYDGIAQRLNENGFNCIAMDQRSGGPIGSAQNETNLSAVEKGKGVDYLDAIQDIEAAIDFVADRYNQDIILWGSSYSSTLVLWQALSNEKVKSVVSFSPGDYFPELGSLTDSLENLKKPFFITSGLWEAEETRILLGKVQLTTEQVHFIPIGDGHHGSRALWTNQSGGEEYWEAVINFLNKLK